MIFTGCSEDDPIDEDHILWKVKIGNGTKMMGGEPFFVNGQVVFASNRTINGKDSPLLFLNPNTGSIEATWGDYLNGPVEDETYPYIASRDNYLAVAGKEAIHCINLQSKSTIWKAPARHENREFYIGVHQMFYVDATNGVLPSKIMATPMNELLPSTKFSLTAGAGAVNRINHFAVSEGGSHALLILGHDTNPDHMYMGLSFFGGSVTTEFQSYLPITPGTENLVIRSNNAVWAASSSLHFIKSYNGSFNKSYYNLSAYCVEDYNGSEFSIINNKVLFKADNCDELRAFELYSGDYITGTINHPNFIEGPFTEYDLKYFFTGGNSDGEGGLNIVDSYTLESVISSGVRAKYPKLIGKIIIDPNTGNLYGHDGHYAYCLAIP